MLAVIGEKERTEMIGIGQYWKKEETHTAEVAFAVRDDYHDKGVGMELFSYLTYLAKKEGLLGFTAEVLMDNRPMLHLCRKMGFDIEKTGASGIYNLNMTFKAKR
jgi:GNAT superfamily N-acetyltransferase